MKKTEKEGETGNRRQEAKEGGKGREGKRRNGVIPRGGVTGEGPVGRETGAGKRGTSSQHLTSKTTRAALTYHGIGLNCPSEILHPVAVGQLPIQATRGAQKKHRGCLTISVTPSSVGPVDALYSEYGARKSMIDASAHLDTGRFAGSQLSHTTDNKRRCVTPSVRQWENVVCTRNRTSVNVNQ